MELAALIAEALLAGAEGAEVLGGLGDDVVEQLEVDAAGASYHMSKSASSTFHPLSHHNAIGKLYEALMGAILRLASLSFSTTLPLASHLYSGPVQVQSLQHVISHCHCHQHWQQKDSQEALDRHVGGSGVKGTTIELWLQ